jgi:hypothetical protein
MNDFNFNIWENSPKKSFVFINKRSNIKNDWLNYDEILKTEYKDSIIKPINKYMYKLSSPPKLVSIIDNTVTLCQENFAEVFLLEKNNKLDAVEKIHMRQFYKYGEKTTENQECFSEIFRWAMSWFIDYDGIDVKISPIDKSPFYFYNTAYTSIKENNDIVEPKMLLFQFKNKGKHIKLEEYGRIERCSPAYLITFKAEDKVILRVKEFYGKD